MRILKFIGAFLGTLIIIFFLSFGFNLDALYTLYNNSEDLQEGQKWVPQTGSLKGLTDYIGQQPQHVSLVSRSAVNPDTIISYGAQKSRTMGTISNFFLITTYARLVENGQLNPQKKIKLDSVNYFQLPYIDGSHHENAVTFLENEGAINDDRTVSLQNLIRATIAHNDLAASDYLYVELGQSVIEQTYELLNIKNTDLPVPFSGLYITLHPELNESEFDTHFESLKSLDSLDFRNRVLANAQKYQTNSEFHEEANRTFDRHQGLGVGFKERRNILSLFPKSTAEELSRLMVQLGQDSLISAGVSKRVKDLMDWPYQQQSLNSDFKYYGAIYDNRLGLLNGIDYGANVYSGEPFGQAVFFDSLEVAFWFHMSSTLMHQDYQQRLMWDPALRAATLQEIQK